jgi:hypothetical protein
VSGPPTRLVGIERPDWLAAWLDASAVFIRADAQGNEYALMLVETRDGGYFVIGNAPREIVEENRADVEAWCQRRRSTQVTEGRATR